MQIREVIPFAPGQAVDLNLELPGSKSITNRVFLIAALAEGKTQVHGALDSDDTRVMLAALEELGISIVGQDGYIEVEGGTFNDEDIELDLHNAGTAVRFLTAAMSLRKGNTLITGDKRMQERPIRDLVDGLKQLGATIEYKSLEGYPPLSIAGGLKADKYEVSMPGNKSSQYFSALLIIAPLLGEKVTINVEGDLVSKPYIETTLSIMQSFGVEVTNNDYKSFEVEPQKYKSPGRYDVEGDASAASYFTSLKHLHGGSLNYTNLNKKSIQGDAAYYSALEQIGTGDINMNKMPDVAMTLAVTAPFYEGTTNQVDIANLRIKETDRLDALETELKKADVDVSTTEDSISVTGEVTIPEGEAIKDIKIGTYNDHRMAMCFAVFGTKYPGIIIEHPGCVDKTYPDFFKDLEKAYLAPIALGDKHLVFTGMRGAGKTYYGQRAAKVLNRTFIDIDAEIEKEVGDNIFNYVKENGWDKFREIEQKICSEVIDREEHSGKPLVISTGGGVILNEENMKHLKKNAINVFIYADPHVLTNRVMHGTNRPPLKEGQDPDMEIHHLWQERRHLYLKYADVTWDDTSGDVIEEFLPELFN